MARFADSVRPHRQPHARADARCAHRAPAIARSSRPPARSPREEFDAGVAELRALGFEPVYDETVFAASGLRRRSGGGARRRLAAGLARSVDRRRSIAVRGGYGSVQLLPLLDRAGVGPGRRKCSSDTATTPRSWRG